MEHKSWRIAFCAPLSGLQTACKAYQKGGSRDHFGISFATSSFQSGSIRPMASAAEPALRCRLPAASALAAAAAIAATAGGTLPLKALWRSFFFSPHVLKEARRSKKGEVDSANRCLACSIQRASSFERTNERKQARKQVGKQRTLKVGKLLRKNMITDAPRSSSSRSAHRCNEYAYPRTSIRELRI